MSRREMRDLWGAGRGEARPGQAYEGPAEDAAKTAAENRPSLASEQRNGRRPTMTDVARLAGVSQSSVSLVLNNMTGARISEATRMRVFEAAAEIGYELPSTRREALAIPEKKTIAYLVDEISTSPHPVVNLDGARDFGWEQGLLVAAHVTRSNPELETATIEAVKRDPSVIGIIYSTIFTRRVTPPAALDGFPTVLLNCHASDRKHLSILPGEVAGGFAATSYLLENGHRRIGFINGEDWMEAAADRLKGYRQALATADIAFDPALVKSADWLPLMGYRLTFELLKLDEPPTAIFCGNDLIAVGALEAVTELGLQVPKHISIMGYDDQELARYTHPPLSTLVLPNYEMGRRAAEALIDMAMHKKPVTPMTLKIDGPLVRRESVGPYSEAGRRAILAARKKLLNGG
jgi:LacI family transcriptional regulator